MRAVGLTVDVLVIDCVWMRSLVVCARYLHAWYAIHISHAGVHDQLHV
jgi:hypothetical protein